MRPSSDQYPVLPSGRKNIQLVKKPAPFIKKVLFPEYTEKQNQGKEAKKIYLEMASNT